MRNTLTIAIVLLVLACISRIPAAQATSPDGNEPAISQKVTLINNIEVDQNLVKIGDLFTNTGDKAEIEVAYAPEPGKRSVFDARWLFRVARTHKLSWRPLSKRVRAVVTRKSDVIERQEIKEFLLFALIEKGVNPQSDLVLSNQIRRLHIPSGTQDDINIQEIHYNKRSQQFSGAIAIPTSNGANKLIRIRGRLFLTREVPVLNRRLLAGEVIKSQDIKWMKVRASHLQSNIILSELDLIGRTPKRGLRAGYPIRTSAVQRPILVAKRSLVTIVLRTPNMFLTATGKALENGADGDVIKISNLQSKTIIEAEVVAAGRVSVRPTTQLAMN